MFDFLKNRRSKVSTPVVPAGASGTPLNTPQHHNIKRELIRVVLKDTLQRHGIPLSWLDCDATLIARPPAPEALHIELVILKWNEQLLRYAPALQRQLLLSLDRFDPSVDHSGCHVSWRFSLDCGDPFVQMPPPSSWHDVVPPPAGQDQIPILDRRHKKRTADSTVGTAASSGRQKKKPSNFSPTQISPLS